VVALFTSTERSTRPSTRCRLPPSAFDNAFATSVAVDAADRILIGGLQATNLLFNTPRLASAARLTAGGIADASFATGGLFTTNVLGNDDVQGISVEPGTGRVLLAGSAGPTTGSSRSAFTLALTDDGEPDASHGPGGAVASALSSVVNCSARGIAVQPDGRLLVSGDASFPEGDRGYLARLNADGTFDASFGTAGLTTLPTDVSRSIGRIVLDSNARIVVSVGSRELSAHLLARFHADGMLDETFVPLGRPRFRSSPARCTRP
jgi:uncharacterized delta-60 repeat protein